MPKRRIPLEEKTRPKVNHLSFSFKYLAQNDEEFGVKHCSAEWFVSFIQRMRDLGGWTAQQLMAQAGDKALRCHPIDWEDGRVSRKYFGIAKEEEIVDKPWQLQVSQGKGRFHGFFVDDTFHVVWLDPNHSLYPG